MSHKASINVFYDAQCPLCRKERRRYERWSGCHADDIGWLDVSEHQHTLQEKGVDPAMAFRELKQYCGCYMIVGLNAACRSRGGGPLDV